MSDLTKILAENQKEVLKLIAPNTKTSFEPQNLENSSSKEENTFIAYIYPCKIQNDCSKQYSVS